MDRGKKAGYPPPMATFSLFPGDLFTYRKMSFYLEKVFRLSFFVESYKLPGNILVLLRNILHGPVVHI